MDQIHTRALEALQPFIHLANSNSATSPRFVANLITNATSNPQTYVFAELLETPTVQALRSKDTPGEYQTYLTLLEIFAWGTWQEYQSTPNLPSLNHEQTVKLRLLSLLSLAATVKPFTYDTLMTTLSISTPSELESLVTTAIYSSLITARLSPASKPPTINVTSVAPLRDVKPQSLPAMISALSEWEQRCGDVIGGIEAEIAKIHADAKKRRDKEQARSLVLTEALSDPASGFSGNDTKTRKATQYRESRGVRLGSSIGGGSGSNKRELSDDEGYHGDEGLGESSLSSMMDVDEGTGASRGGVGGGIARHAKRVLGKKKS